MIAALLALAAWSASASEAVAQTDWTSLRTLNIAHQGGEDEAPSNTMYAYDRAMRLGADMLELDVHTTADGRVVVMHDATVDRTTNGTGAVDEMTLEQIQNLDAAHDFVPGEGTANGLPRRSYPFRGVRTAEKPPPPGYRPDDFRIPTLAQVLRRYPEVPTNIEIKGSGDTDVASYLRNAEHLAALLNRIGRTEGLIVVSFHDEAIQRFHQLAPEVDLAPGLAGVAAFKLASVPPGPGEMVAFQVPIDFEGVPVTDRDFVNRAHAGGYAVHVWTINDEPTMRRLFDWGVDGIMTAETGRLEGVLCAQDIPRPPRADGLPGHHCNQRRASIACDVRPRGAVMHSGADRLRVRLRRRDDFDGRCAGSVRVRFPHSRRAAVGRFSFGKHEPSAGGPKEVEADLRLPASLAAARGPARVIARPYGAFAHSARLPVR